MKVRIAADGSILRVLPDGRTEPLADDLPDDDALDHARPEAVARLVRVARARSGLTQAAFAVRLRLPAATLRDWEQGRRIPDAAAITLLRLAAGAPQAIRRLTTRFASPKRALVYLGRFAGAAPAPLLEAEIALVLRHSPFDARALAEAAGDASPKLRQALAVDRAA